jgi:hypothetical protein
MHRAGGDPVREDELVRVNVLIGREQRRRLFHILVDEEQSFSAWVRKHIDAYLKEKEPKNARVRELVDRRQDKRWTDIPNDTGRKTRKPKGKRRKGRKVR